MRERLCSSWTVTLNYQTFIALATAFRQTGNADRAAEFETRAAAILGEFQSTLIVDGVLTGLAYFQEGGKTDYLLHPRDATTGLSYSLLAMIHAIINDMFTPDQAEFHLGIIRMRKKRQGNTALWFKGHWFVAGLYEAGDEESAGVTDPGYSFYSAV